MGFRSRRERGDAALSYPVVGDLGLPGCALCRHADRVDRQAAWSFLYEGRDASELLDGVRAAGGFCRHHGDLVLSVAMAGDLTAGLAAVYEYLIAGDRGAIAAAGKRRRGAGLFARGGCPLCRRRRQAESRMAAFVAGRLVLDAQVRRTYEGCDGFCRVHLVEVLDATDDADAARWLLADADRRLRALAAGLHEYRRKRDHRFHAEPRGDEQRAPLSARRFYSPQRFGDGVEAG